jgi:hypothetical protein
MILRGFDRTTNDIDILLFNGVDTESFYCDAEGGLS